MIYLEGGAEDFASDLLAHLLANYPGIRFALFSNTADPIIRTYMGAGWGNGQHNNCGGLPIAVSIQAYAGDLSAIRAENHDAISTFYLTGLGHTVLRIGYYITSVQGKTVPEWLSQVLSGQIIHVGP